MQYLSLKQASEHIGRPVRWRDPDLTGVGFSDTGTFLGYFDNGRISETAPDIIVPAPYAVFVRVPLELQPYFTENTIIHVKEIFPV